MNKHDRAESQVPVLKFTLIQSTGSKSISKHLTLDADVMLAKPYTAASLYQGNFWTTEVTGIDGFAAVLKEYHGKPDHVLMFGCHRALPSGAITTKENATPGAVTRTKENFPYRAGQPGILMLDFDLKNGDYRTAHDLDAIIREKVWYLANVKIVWKPSATSHVHYGQKWVSRKNGWHACFAVDDASLIKEVGEDIFIRLFDGGEGRIDISEGLNAGLLKRCLIDASVFDGSRLDFAFGGILAPGLSQPHRDFIETFGSEEVLPCAVLVSKRHISQWKEWEKQSPVLTRLLAEAKPRQAALQAERRGVEIKRRVDLGQALAAASEAVDRLLASANAGGTFQTLDAHCLLTTSDGEIVTVGELLANPERWHGKTFRDPREHNYPSRTCAKAYLIGQYSGKPYINSRAHGTDTKYELVDFEKMFPALPGLVSPGGTPWTPQGAAGAVQAAAPRPASWMPPEPTGYAARQGAVAVGTTGSAALLMPPTPEEYAARRAAVNAPGNAAVDTDLMSILQEILKTHETEWEKLSNELPRRIACSGLNEMDRATAIKAIASQSKLPIDAVRRTVRTFEEESATVVGMDGKPLAGGRKPVIRIVPGTMHTMVEEAERALCDATVAIYGRQTSLVRPVADAIAAGRKRKVRVPRLVEVNEPWLWNELSVHIEWKRYLKSEGTWVPANPEKDVAKVILARQGNWQFPQITGLTCCPTMLADGRLIGEEGFDAETGLLLWAPPHMPHIPDQPTRADALQALATLEGLLDEFPFVNDVARSVALSALMTPVLRGGIDNAPAHGFKAYQAGTGKSYLQDLAAAIAIGDICPVMPIGRTDEESEKRLGAAMMTGQPIISFDNVNGAIGFDLLCQAIDRPIVEVRVLGMSKTIKVPNRSVIFLNGNNMKVTGDMCRRVIVSTLDSKWERPEMREFQRNPLAEILADRGKYVAAVLTIARAYVLAGHPGKLKPIQSFCDWSDMVRSPLGWLGKADPAEAMQLNFQDDPERQNHSEFMQAFVDNLGDGPERNYSAAELINFGTYGWTDPNNNNNQYPMLSLRRVMLPWSSPRPSSAFGQWLSKKEGTNVDNMIIRKINNTKNGHRWYIERAFR